VTEDVLVHHALEPTVQHDVCPACGAVTPPSDAPAHAYIAASPGCWASFGRLQLAAAQKWPDHPDRALIVDAYAAQHPGDGSDRRDRQSVWVHVAALEAVLVSGWPPERSIDVRRTVLAPGSDFPRLAAPQGPRPLTHLVLSEPDPGVIRRWARSVLGWWGASAQLVRERLVALDLARG
jgi:3-oxoacyl-(acyl-carrier-protein) synthase